MRNSGFFKAVSHNFIWTINHFKTHSEERWSQRSPGLKSHLKECNIPAYTTIIGLLTICYLVYPGAKSCSNNEPYFHDVCTLQFDKFFSMTSGSWLSMCSLKVLELSNTDSSQSKQDCEEGTSRVASLRIVNHSTHAGQLCSDITTGLTAIHSSDSCWTWSF